MANSKRRFYILSVQPLKNNVDGYGLGLMTQDAVDLKINKSKIDEIHIDLIGTLVIIDNAIGTYKKHRRLESVSITNWIITNRLHKTEKGKPVKLVFALKSHKNKHVYTLYKNQLNLK